MAERYVGQPVEERLKELEKKVAELKEQKEGFSELFEETRIYHLIKIVNLEKVLREFMKKVFIKLMNLFWACESEGQTHEEDLTYEQKYDKLQKIFDNYRELLSKLEGDLSEHDKKIMREMIPKADEIIYDEDGTYKGEMTHKEAAKYEKEHPDEFDTKDWNINEGEKSVDKPNVDAGITDFPSDTDSTPSKNNLSELEKTQVKLLHLYDQLEKIYEEPKELNEGEKEGILGSKSIPSEMTVKFLTRTDSTPSNDVCSECGNLRSEHIYTGREWICPDKSKEPPDDDYKVRSEPYWLIPRDIDDYFRNHPDTLPKIKYDRLLESLPTREDLEFLIKNLEVYTPIHHKTGWFEQIKEKYLRKGDDDE